MSERNMSLLTLFSFLFVLFFPLVIFFSPSSSLNNHYKHSVLHMVVLIIMTKTLTESQLVLKKLYNKLTEFSTMLQHQMTLLFKKLLRKLKVLLFLLLIISLLLLCVLLDLYIHGILSFKNGEINFSLINEKVELLVRKSGVFLYAYPLCPIFSFFFFFPHKYFNISNIFVSKPSVCVFFLLFYVRLCYCK